MTYSAAKIRPTPHTPLSSDEDDWKHLFDEIARGASERERTRTLPFEAVDLLRQARFGALRLAPADGGAGASFRQLYALTLDLAAADPNVAHIFRNHFTVVEQFTRRATDAQGQAWRKAAAEGALFGLANGEANAAPAGGTRPDTRLVPDGKGFRLHGVKYYCTGTLYSDYVLVRAGTEDGRMAAVIIPTTREGVEVLDDWDGAGQRLTGSGTTRFNDVWVEPSEAVFDGPDQGYGIAYANTQAQLFLTTVVAGIAQGVLQDALALVNRRKRSFYYALAPLPADDPLIQQTIGELAANAFAARATVLAAADALDRKSIARENGQSADILAAAAARAAAQAKLVVDQLTLRSSTLLYEAGGASATERTVNLDRHWRNARTIASHNPASLKARAIGALLVKGEPLPEKGFF
ncbi:acyl-CoA dehydrogenase family protein [Xanthobacter sp. TB0136]|uniref:acyl-CoA dehydrogenase family protein n=1 Tax=Xanthobacter sp. TB0136 TaxID=3459177 RepID=UPI0040397001